MTPGPRERLRELLAGFGYPIAPTRVHDDACIMALLEAAIVIHDRLDLLTVAMRRREPEKHVSPT